MKAIPLQNQTVGRTSLTLFGNFLSGLVILGLMIRFFIKDRIAAFSFVYYATPWPILAIISFLAGIIWLLGKRSQFARFCFILAMGCVTAWSGESFSLNAGATSPSNLKLFFWNAANKKFRAEEIANYIHGANADLIGLVEAGITGKRVENTAVESIWRSVFSNYHVAVLAYGMALITKGKILSTESGSLGRRGHFNLLKVALNDELFYVVLVDLDANLLRSRTPAFAQLAKLIRAHAPDNLIVMGDFNTPLDSVLFESFRQQLNHAFESAGVGFAETWPIPVPVLAIDHIWVSKKIKVASCRLNWSWLSDHRAIVADIERPVR